MDTTFRKETTDCLDNSKRVSHRHDVSDVTREDQIIPAKKRKINQELEDDDDDIIITNVEADNNINFELVGPRWQHDKSRVFGLHVMFHHPPANNRCISLDTKPVKLVQTIGDGNCLFRSMSYMVTGTQFHHTEIRTGVLQFMLKNSDLFKNYINEPVFEYIKRTGMWKCGRWGTDVEIRAFASMVNSNVFVYCYYGGKTCWTKFPPLTSTADSNIYLRLFNNHYEPVVDVEDVTSTKASTNCVINNKSKLNPEGFCPKKHSPLHSSSARNGVYRRMKSGRVRLTFRPSGISIKRFNKRTV